MARKTIPAINIQHPWSQLILSGQKTLETRFYPLPAKYVGQPLAIVETPGSNRQVKSRIVGFVVFGQSFRYKSKNAFYRDKKVHLVDSKDSSFSWEQGGGKAKWGWPIEKVIPMEIELPDGLRRGIVFTKSIGVPPQAVSDLASL